jgi:nucleotide-binding universal stress UspA family protein
MYRSILVPLDGSAFAEHALPLAVSIARRAKATLQLAHVDLVPSSMYVLSRPNMESTYDARVKERAAAYLDNVVWRLSARTPVPVETVLLEGSVTEALEEHIALKGVDLVVMTTHGRGAIRRAWLGSVADKLLRHLSVPIVMVRPREEPHDLTVEPVLRRVLIPLDSSALAEQILEPALTLGGLMQSEYTLLHVVEPMLVMGDEMGAFAAGAAAAAIHAQLPEEGRKYLGNVIQRLGVRGQTVQSKVIVDQTAADGILEEAKTAGHDLIALATHAHGGLVRFLLGSVADKVLRGATVPVLVYRPQKE